MSDLFSLLILSVCFLIIFFAGDLMYTKLKLPSEYSRKFSHVFSGLLACTFPFMFSSHWWVMIICSSFLLLLYVSIRFKFLKGINSVERKTYGSILYPIAIYVCYLLNIQLQESPDNNELYFISVLIMVFSDPMAAIVGKNFPMHRFRKIAKGKSIGGSFAFFVSAFIIVYSILPYENKLLISLTLAFATTITELLCSKGLDNILVPLCSFTIFWIFQL